MRIFLDTIGCRLNQAEIEILARQFRAAGHSIVGSAADAELAVINTCTVTSGAAADSRSRIRGAARLGAGRVVATGCWATLEPQAAASLPGVSCIIPNQEKDKLAAHLLGLPMESFDLESVVRQPLPGYRSRTRAFIKVQDGCDNACTFCAATLARGACRSRPLEAVLSDVSSALEGGTQELVLTGVHLGSWGVDFDHPQRLADLVSALLSRTEVARLRLSSLEPWDLDDAFFQLWQDPRLCRHLHLPLQSGSASVLHRMARKIDPETYAALVETARRRIPGVAITTDLISGFPGESEAEFMETLTFVQGLDLAGGHLFTFSARPGTPAARMKGRVGGEILRQRSAALRGILADSAAAYRRKFIGLTLPVLWESTDRVNNLGWRLAGWTGNYLRVVATAAEPRWNRIDPVYLSSEAGEGLEGDVIGPMTGESKRNPIETTLSRR